MEDTLGSSLARLSSLTAGLGCSPDAGQLEQLRLACASVLAAARSQPPSTAQQKQLWAAAAGLWNASIDLGTAGTVVGSEVAVAALLHVVPDEVSDEAACDSSQHNTAVATLLQAACELCSPLVSGALPQAEHIQLVRFHCKAGQAWAQLGQYEAAEAVLSHGSEAAAALAPLCFERRGRGPQHQDAAALLSTLQLERVRAALRLNQQMLASELIARAVEFAADTRLPSSEGLAMRLALIELLREEGKRLAQAGQAADAAPLLSTTYDTLSQIDLPDAEGDEAELGQLAAEVQAIGAQVLTLLAWCSAEVGEPERALSCLQALQQVAGEASAAHFSSAYLSLRCLLQLGRIGEAEAQLLNLVSNEDVTPEACLAGLQAALQAPGGAPLAKAVLTMVLERFSEEPGMVVELVRTALQAASSCTSNITATEAEGGGTAEGVQAPAVAAVTAAEAEELVLELVGDDRLLENVCDPSQGGGVLLRHQLVGLLWNHAVRSLAAEPGCKTYGRAHAFFSAVLPLLERGGGGGGGDDGATQEDEGTDTQDGQPQAVVCCRSLALCCLGLRQHARALEHLDAADRLAHGSVPTAMLRLTVQLAAGSKAGAAAAVTALAGSPGADADVLRIACCQCVDAGSHTAARQALECLLERCAATSSAGATINSAADRASSAAAGGGLQAPGYEATIFQNLIQLYLDSPVEEAMAEEMAAAAGTKGAAPAEQQQQQALARRSSQLASLFDRLVQRMQAVGPATFFALEQPDGGRRCQLEWLALQAWNAGQRAGTARALQPAGVLLAVAGELYAALPGASVANLHKQKTAFLMAATCACEVSEAQLLVQQQAEAAAGAEAGAPPLPDGGPPAAGQHSPAGSSASFNLARSYLQQARAAAAQQALMGSGSNAAAGQGPGGDAKSDVYILLLDFKLCCLEGDTSGQVEVLARARALPAFGAHHFAMAAGLARGGGGSPDDGKNGGGKHGRCSLEVLRVAEEGRLQRLTGELPLDYAAVAVSLRYLLELTPGDTDKLHLLGEAAGLLAGAPPGMYPVQELRWLVTTAWNRGAVHARFGRGAEARSYQRWAADALRYDGGMAGQYKELMQEELERCSTTVEGHLCTVERLGSLAI